MKYSIVAILILYFVLIVSCSGNTESEHRPAKVETLGVDGITENSAVCKGGIIDAGTRVIAEFGMEVEDGTGYKKYRRTTLSGAEFGVTLTGLNPDQTYKYLAYIDDGSIQYGTEKEFTTLKKGEGANPGLTSLEILSGYNRLQIVGVFSSLSGVAYIKIGGIDTQEPVIIEAGEIENNKFERILELPEKEYLLELTVYDHLGREIIKETAPAIIYGEAYRSTLQNVELKSLQFNITDNSLIFNWGEVSQYVLRTEFTYTNIHLDEKTVLNPTALNDIATGYAKYRTAYLPVENMLDTLYTEFETVEVGDNENRSTGNNPFIQGNEGYFAYRIPSMVVTNNGTILAFAEGRRNSIEDTGDIDIVLKRSTDNGSTWSPLEIVKDDGVNRCQNPVPIHIPETNRIILLTCWNVGASGDRRVFVTYSDDEGKTWAEEKEISASVKPGNWNWYATGPCHGIVKTYSPHKGRIVVPCNHTLNGGGGISYSHIIFSDDGGITWELGGEPCADTNESTVVELSNGDLMLNMRRTTSPNNRVVSTSSDGGITWKECWRDNTLISPGCQGSIFRYDLNGENGKARILFSNPAHETSRRNNTLRLSNNDGETWTKKRMYVENTGQSVFYGAYSDIAKLIDGDIAMLYEKGYRNEEGIWFRKIDISELE